MPEISNENLHLERFGFVRQHEPLRLHTTYRIGGEADWFVCVDDLEKLEALVHVLNETHTPWMVLGNGSNVLVSDQPYHGVVISLMGRFMSFSFSDTILEASAGCSLILLSVKAMEQSLSGLEFASGIPGTLGGGIYMNAGAYLSDLSNLIIDVTYLDEEGIKTCTKDELGFTYRHSVFQQHKNRIILSARLQLERKDKESIRQLMDSRKQRRLSSQPVSRPSAGSVFRNPESGSAWKIVDDLGFRGKRCGGAKVSEIHSNFIINEEGKAKAAEVDCLIREIQKAALETFGVQLITEVERIIWDEQEQLNEQTEPGSGIESE